ncbi:penicillin-binding protein 2 [Sphingomonas solaris]|uniref:Penicillin-binding protein 2 n=1 Tax=Alterirhizorhabdus solaris TaxID=2529389 RepID=A0A558RCW6_9SPHN|nr:penicillin-binding protein 2 [Sphingomonas solaris]TVV77327.1 penicillin-binding protein 2 [Sphingomonas solaris]
MRRPTRIVTEHAQSFTFTRRALVLGGAQFAVGGVLAGRMGWLAIAQNERYRLMAESNRVQLLLIPPRRGWIVDRYGKPIAINRTDFRVDLIPDQLHDPDHVLAELQKILSLPDEEMARIREELEKAAGYQPVPVAEKLDYDRFAAVSVRLPDLAGVAPARGYSRYYPTGAAVGQLCGYVGAASAKDYEETHDPLLITPGFKVGKEGLEKTMEPLLRGKPGAKRSEVTARGRLVRDLETRPDVAGRALHLTIDIGLQDYAARRLGPESGSVVVMDCRTGDLLAMASMPSYDPNSFSDGISHSEWDMLSANDHHPLINKVLSGLYPPGSTVKPMNALALLNAGISADERVVCTGQYRLGNTVFHCHKRRGHGALDMKHAIMQSCDIYFYTMIRRIGIDALATMMRDMGLGEEYALPVASQRYGTVPDSAWKQRKYKTGWTVADTINASIGQGYTLTNPLQLAVMAARLASGRQVSPRLIAGGAQAPAPPLDIPPEHFAIVRDAMSGVVNGGGTGGSARMYVPGVMLAGKTGTAQVRRISMAERRRGVLSDSATPWRLRDHSLFVCFAPVENPRYACATILEHSGHIVTAAPIARDTLTYLFDPKRAMAQLAPLEEKWGGDILTRTAAQGVAWRTRNDPPPAVVPPAAAPVASSPAAPSPAATPPATPAPAPIGTPPADEEPD